MLSADNRLFDIIILNCGVNVFFFYIFTRTPITTRLAEFNDRTACLNKMIFYFFGRKYVLTNYYSLLRDTYWLFEYHDCVV